MADEKNLQLEWVKANKEYLGTLFDLEAQWATSTKAAHACGHLKTTDINVCIDDLNDAWNEAVQLETQVNKYLKTLSKLRALAETMKKAAEKSS